MEMRMSADNQEYRIEHDTMGDVKVPKNALYAAQTQRAVENFPISGNTITPHHIAALGHIKRAAALSNLELGVIDEATSKAIVTARRGYRRQTQRRIPHRHLPNGLWHLL